MKKELPFEALTKGYILVPKMMLERMFGSEKRELSECEAMLRLLVMVNYKDEYVARTGCEPLLCRRGESVRSWNSWSELFGWHRSRTRRFFQRLQRQKFLELTVEVGSIHLRVVDYELWAGCRSDAMRQMAENADREFLDFWDQYHDLTGKSKVNPGKARKEWGKLSANERRLAVEHIEDYYVHLSDTKFCLQAVNYLMNKAFLNEYAYEYCF